MEHELFQLFDTDSSTFTYVLVDRATREAIVVDSVDARFDREVALLRRLGLTLRYVVETHTHADHVTAAGRLREATGALAATPFGCGISPADVQLARRIHRLLTEEGYTVRGVQKLLRDGGGETLIAAIPAAAGTEPSPPHQAAGEENGGVDVFRLIALRNRLEDALKD